MTRYHKIAALLCLFVLLWSTGCVENGDKKENIVTFGELVNDYDRGTNEETNTIHEYFSTFDDGDTIIIKDTINDIIYREESNDTGIEFISYLGERFSIKGNITNEFKKGEIVEITLHIIAVNYTKKNTDTEEIWTFNREIFQEGWDTKNNTLIPIPQEYIHHVTYENGKKVMAFQELLAGYNETYNNEEKKIISDFLPLEKGDTILIWDTIDNITYLETDDYTVISFISSPTSRFRIQGNITGDYQEGDSIEIELNVIKTSFTETNPYTNETWTIETETFKQIWNNENRGGVPLPQEYLRHR